MEKAHESVLRSAGSGISRRAEEAELPDELQALERSGHLPTFVPQLRWSEVSSGGVAQVAALLPQELQAVVHQLQHTQQVELAAGVQAARAQLEESRRASEVLQGQKAAQAGIRLT